MSDFKVERTYKEVGVIKKQGTDLTHLVTKFNGPLDGLKTMTVKPGVGEYSWVQSLIVPLKSNETIYIHPDQTGVGVGFVRIIHSHLKAIAVFHKSHFDTIL
jgi:hypothetical protein